VSKEVPIDQGRAGDRGDPLFTCRVSFRGPPLTRHLRDALTAARITVLDRHEAVGWGGQVQEYLVSLSARDQGDAVSRIRAVLDGGGSFAAFSAA
jgi:hypothetical protein